MDDVYLLNSPFTFQSMEKHAAYCAMLRLGLKVPQTVLVPHKNPPDNARFAYTAAKYNQPFDLDEIAESVGYPLFMKPYDGGQWIGVIAHQGQPPAPPGLRRVRPAPDAPAGVGRGLRRLRPLAVDRRRDDDHALPARGADARPLRGRPRLPHARARRRGHDDQPPDQRVLPLGVQLLRDARARHRGAPDRLRQRVTRRRADEPPLLLPVGDERAAEVVARSASSPAASRGWTSTRATTSRSATARTSATRRSSPATASSPTPTSRSTATGTSSTAGSATSTSSCSSGSRAPSSTACCSTPCSATYPPHEHERFIGHLRGLVGQWVSERGAAATWQS